MADTQQVNDWVDVPHPAADDWQDVSHPAKSSFDGFLDQVREFAGAAAHELNPATMLKNANDGVQSAFYHPLATAQGMAETNAKALDQAKDAWKRGDYTAAAAHAFNYLAPFGSSFNDQTNDVESGHTGRALGKALAFGVQMAAPEVVKGVVKTAPAAVARAVGTPILQKIVDASPRPLSEGAQALAEKYGVPLTRGAQGGSRTVQAAEKMLGHTVAPDLYESVIEKAQQGVDAGAKDLSGGFGTDRFTAGENTIGKMLGTAKDLEDVAHGEYGNLRSLEADPANATSVQVGTNPDGAPKMETQGLPVDMRPAKQALAPIVDEYSRRMTPAQRSADPGLAAIKNILTRPDSLPASVAEADLGYLKEILRGDASGQAKRLAGKAIDAMDMQVKTAVSQAGPDAVDSLERARQTWKNRTDILDTVKQLAGDTSGRKGQVLLTNKLLQPADASFPDLRRVLAIAPDAASDIGQAFLSERVFKKVSGGESLTNPTQASNLWNQIGPRTKEALYTPGQITDINDFLELAKRVSENPNPSNTGSLNAMLKMGVLVTNPIHGGSALVLGRNLAKVLYAPDGAANLKLALQAGNPAQAGTAMQAVKTLMRAGATAPEDNGARGNVIPFPSPQTARPGAAASR